MPMTMDEYRRGQLYAVAKASNQETEGDSGVEVLVNEPYEKGEYTGQYTKKIYHLGSKIPGWLAAIAPASALKLFEESWNGFPHIKTDLQSPFMGARFTYTVETLHFDNDKGEQENVHNLDKKQLKIREVKHIDIVDPVPDGADTSTFHSEVTERGPLRRGWQDEVKPMMCCYKLVTVNFKYFGLQTKVESALIDVNIIISLFIDIYLNFILVSRWFICKISST